MSAAPHPPTAPLALPLVYINLAEDEARRAELEAAFAAAAIAPTRFAAIRWSRLDAAEQAALYSEALNARSYFRPLVDGEKGCYASHIATWKALLASTDRAWVVLEDDVRPEPGLADVVAAIAALPAGWDMVKLIGRERENALNRWPLTGRFELVSYRRVPSLTAGYAVSRSGASKLLASRQPFGRPIDVDLRLWWENRLVMRGVVPAAIALAPNQSSSSIGSRHGDASLARRWKKFMFKLRYTLANRRARKP
jgi:glycosyl transferase family 25